MTYERVFERCRLPVATYVFTDLDRLHFWDLELAARLFRHLRSHQLKVLNDPALSRSRLQLLRHFYQTGLNPFNAWGGSESPPIDSYPVFLRTDSAHRGPATGLLQSPEELEQARAGLLTAGVPMRELMTVQFAAEPVAENLFRKFSIHRVGDNFLAGQTVHQRAWAVKQGQRGSGNEALYAEELETVRNNPFEPFARKVFAAADIDYGRLDFAVVNNKAVAYEINTNPSISVATSHPFPDRVASSRLILRNLETAFAALDTEKGGRIPRMRASGSIRARLRDLFFHGRLSRKPAMP